MTPASNLTWMLDRGVVSGWGAGIGAPRELARIEDSVRRLVAIGEHAVMLGDEGAAIWMSDAGITTRRDHASLVAVAGRTSRFFCEISGTDAWCSGDGSRMSPPTPVSLSPLTDARWMQLAVGWGHGCALGSDGITCWGRNGDGQLSNGDWSDDPNRAFAPRHGLLPD